MQANIVLAQFHLGVAFWGPGAGGTGTDVVSGYVMVGYMLFWYIPFDLDITAIALASSLW